MLSCISYKLPLSQPQTARVLPIVYLARSRSIPIPVAWTQAGLSQEVTATTPSGNVGMSMDIGVPARLRRKVRGH